MATQDDYMKTALRLPRELHAKLTASAEATGKSLNAEMISRLEQSFQFDAGALASTIARLSMMISLTDTEKLTEQLRSTIIATHLRSLCEKLLPILDPADTESIKEMQAMINEASIAIHSPDKLRQESMKRFTAMRKNLEYMKHIAGVDDADTDLDDLEREMQRLTIRAEAAKKAHEPQ